eukprot:TRINITY_DN12154_c0_g1_i4.p1 TRINITY_DN12154_c0_g1~~TRINITY_DN12154_c0_g1_i4.p1  ORF type:complete len:740 (+),score=140.16 TRINITY_DN12154_c0_g1_i4:330-2222(+)
MQPSSFGTAATTERDSQTSCCMAEERGDAEAPPSLDQTRLPGRRGALPRTPPTGSHGGSRVTDVAGVGGGGVIVHDGLSHQQLQTPVRRCVRSSDSDAPMSVSSAPSPGDSGGFGGGGAGGVGGSGGGDHRHDLQDVHDVRPRTEPQHSDDEHDRCQGDEASDFANGAMQTSGAVCSERSDLTPFDGPLPTVQQLLRRLGGTTEAWKTQFAAIDEVRRLTVFASNVLLADSGGLGSIVEGVIVHTQSLRSALAKNALRCLGELFASLSPRQMDRLLLPALPACIRRAADTNRFISEEAERALQEIAVAGSVGKLVGPLVENAGHKNPLIRVKAVWALGLLVQRLRTKDREGSTSSIPAAVSQAVARAMEDANAEVRQAARLASNALRAASSGVGGGGSSGGCGNGVDARLSHEAPPLQLSPVRSTSDGSYSGHGNNGVIRGGRGGHAGHMQQHQARASGLPRSAPTLLNNAAAVLGSGVGGVGVSPSSHREGPVTHLLAPQSVPHDAAACCGARPSSRQSEDSSVISGERRGRQFGRGASQQQGGANGSSRQPSVSSDRPSSASAKPLRPSADVRLGGAPRRQSSNVRAPASVAANGSGGVGAGAIACGVDGMGGGCARRAGSRGSRVRS